jgi:uncharacterized surface protein with fasciclin (FAS1) repeats
MAIINRSSFTLVLTALLSSAVNGQSNINYAQCLSTSDTRVRQNTGFDDDIEGNERRTYGNLCSGSLAFGSTATETPIPSRNGDPFRRFCDLIDRYPNVQNLMATGNSPHTVFAPTDAAFAKIDGLLGRVDEQRLLELHILPQARYTRDLRCGQTYRTINTQQDRRNTQRSKTQCVTADKTQQIGPGNTVNGLNPTIGNPNNIFPRESFQNQDFFDVTYIGTDVADDLEDDFFAQDVTSCNGVIHVVDEILLPGGDVLRPYNYGAAYGPPTYGAPYNAPYNAPYGAVPSSYGSYNSYYGYYGGPNPAYGPGYGVRRPSYYGNLRYNNYYGKANKYAKKGFKGGKGAKGAKGYGPLVRPPQVSIPYNNYYFRKLTGEESNENTLSDAEFFGTEGLAGVETSEKNEGNRKRRLEALLEPDGNIEVV